jgi:hypothetical protein
MDVTAVEELGRVDDSSLNLRINDPWLIFVRCALDKVN